MPGERGVGAGCIEYESRPHLTIILTRKLALHPHSYEALVNNVVRVSVCERVIGCVRGGCRCGLACE